jgi:hypothetical protein
MFTQTLPILRQTIRRQYQINQQQTCQMSGQIYAKYVHNSSSGGSGRSGQNLANSLKSREKGFEDKFARDEDKRLLQKLMDKLKKVKESIAPIK